jgi:hypothetical protein
MTRFEEEAIHADRGSSSWQPRGQLAVYLTPGYEETFDRAWRGRCHSFADDINCPNEPVRLFIAR